MVIEKKKTEKMEALGERRLLRQREGEHWRERERKSEAKGEKSNKGLQEKREGGGESKKRRDTYSMLLVLFHDVAIY